MFVYKKLNASGSTTVQIISKQRGKNHIIRTLGTSKDPEKVNSLCQDAHAMIPSLSNQLVLFPDSQDAMVQLVRELRNDDIRIGGPYSVFGRIFNHLGFNIIKDDLFRDLVISRITHPGSKLRLREMLAQTGRKDISVDSIYRFMDKLNKTYQSQVEQISFSHTKKLLGGNIGAVFYDMTTIYFESSKPDELRVTGFSKDGKHQHPQIYLGLLVGSNGYPIGYNIFEGNIYEGHTLIPMIESFEHRFTLDKPIIVADSGLLSKRNIESLQQKKYTFILGARIKNERQNITIQIEKLKLENGKTAEIDKGDGLRLIISYSDKRAEKDRLNRERGLKRLEKSLNAGKLTKSNINNRGYNKYLKMEGDVSITIDYSKFEKDETWDGLKGYITNSNLSPADIIKHYSNLWKIERAFRISKTDLKVRPIYHRRRNRIEAHICISFVSFVLYKELERTLAMYEQDISITKAIDQINKMYEVQVRINDGQKLNIPLQNNLQQQKIMNALDRGFPS